MKYVKHGLLVAISASLLACASKQTEPENETATAVVDKVLAPVVPSVEVKNTQAYLPIQTLSEQGQFLPYEPQKNPYIAAKTQVNKGSVLLFLEAKKAWREEDYDRVEQKLSVIIKKDPSLSGPWVMLAKLSLQRQQLKQAQQQLEKALALNPLNVNIYPLLAQTQRQTGEYAQAQVTLAKALALWPDFPEAHYNLAILYDAYLNDELAAQQHLEAFMFIEQDIEQADYQWLQDLSARTGVRKSYVGELAVESPFLLQAEALLAEQQ